MSGGRRRESCLSLNGIKGEGGNNKKVMESEEGKGGGERQGNTG